jgi:transmembrane sensor
MSESQDKSSTVSPSELDEAAVWMARLHAPERTLTVEKGFQRWLVEKPSHAAAFETISTAWDLSGALRRRPFPKLTRWERAGFRSGFLRAATAVCSIALLALLGTLLYVRSSGYSTGIGEQRVLSLDDGSRVTLNTSSRVVVSYSERERRIDLKQGEAFFEVAKNPDRPFIVIAGTRQVRAVGTEFMVRRDEQRLAITLVEGKVAVSALAGPVPSGSQAGEIPTGAREDGYPASDSLRAPQRRSDRAAALQPEVFMLTPGQRLTFSARRPPQLDAPSVEQISAWRLGHIELDDTVLADAVAEMNRYSATQIVIERPEAAALHINGVFRTGDTAAFAAALARSYGLTIEHGSHQLMLAGIPSVKRLSQPPAK